MASYRILKDEWAGYEVRVWRWWWPFWVQAGGSNTFGTEERAEKYAHYHAKHGRIAKDLGRL